MKAHRILLVEDHAPLRELLQEGLREEGFEVVAAASGPDGLEAFRTMGPCDLFLLDEELPGLTGRELLAAIRREGARAPALIYSGSVELSEEDRERLGIRLVLRKPLPLEELVKAIRDALGRT